MARMLSMESGKVRKEKNRRNGNERNGSEGEPVAGPSSGGDTGGGYSSFNDNGQPVTDNSRIGDDGTYHRLDSQISVPGKSVTGLSSNTWRWLGLGMFFLFYLALGASVFSAIESPIEQKATKELMEKRVKFLKKNPCVSTKDLDELMGTVVDANNRGVPLPVHRQLSNGTLLLESPTPPSWSFGQSFFFATTVVTTIGYGHQSPLSTSGKVFCILYALIGIPLTLMVLTSSVERMIFPFNCFLAWLNSQLGHIHTPFFIRILHLFLVILMVVTFFFLIPAAIFTELEPSWYFSDALYYCFISLTTIGLGDFIPGDEPGQRLRPFYKACTAFYLLVGVTAMMTILTIIYSIPELDVSGQFLSCGNTSNAIFNTHEQLPSDPERIRLQSSGSTGPKYTQHLEPDTASVGSSYSTRRIVRARSRPDDDSPDELYATGTRPRLP